MLFNEPKLLKSRAARGGVRHAARGFSALQRAEIAEIGTAAHLVVRQPVVSVLFNEPKLLKSFHTRGRCRPDRGFSALQRAEIAEINEQFLIRTPALVFQCSSTSRNC